MSSPPMATDSPRASPDGAASARGYVFHTILQPPALRERSGSSAPRTYSRALLEGVIGGLTGCPRNRYKEGKGDRTHEIPSMLYP
jgi:hypothetical protein